MLQRPPQQSTSFAHESPFCAQNEGAAQRPPEQNFPQHSAPAAHGLPCVLHVVLSGVHVPLPHLPPQHSPSVAHAALSAMHCLAAHFPAMHDSLQQSVFAAHGASGAPHVDVDSPHLPAATSQLLVQHSALPVQPSPTGLHVPLVVDASMSSALGALPHPTKAT